MEIEYHINHTFLERFELKMPRLYDIGGHEEAAGIVAEGEIAYGKK